MDLKISFCIKFCFRYTSPEVCATISVHGKNIATTAIAATTAKAVVKTGAAAEAAAPAAAASVSISF